MPNKKANRIKFTKAYLNSVPLPTGNRHHTYYDSEVNKLSVFVYGSGKKVFYIITKYNGKCETIKVGDYKEISIENARKKASEILGDLARSVNPQDAKRVLRKEMTFEAAYNWFVNKYAPTRKKPSSIAEDMQ